MASIRIGPAPFIHVEHAGQGDLVLFLHGIGGNSSNWRRQVEALSGRYLAAAWDARGWGGSDDYDGPLRLEDMVADAMRVLDHFGKREAHVVGLSMGGLVAQHIWHAHPGRVRSLALCDTSPGLSRSQTREEQEQFLRLRQKPLLEGKTPADIAPGVARSLISPNGTPDALAELTASIAALHTESYLKALEMVTFHEMTHDIGGITVPCLLVVGADAALCPPSIHADMHARIPGSRLVVLPDAGHLSNIEQPDAFTRALEAFLADVG